MSSPTVSGSSLPAMSESSNSSWSPQADGDDFDYMPVSPWGPVALVLGIASLTGLTNSTFGLGLAGVGVVIGVSAVIRLLSARGAFRGIGFAVTGMLLSVLCLVFGYMKLMHAYETECPEGFRRTSFTDEISEYKFVNYGGARRLHPEVAPLIGQKVFVKGYMWNTMDTVGLTEFVFLKDNGECCFGGKPAAYDKMVVYLGEDEDGVPRTTDAFTCRVAVAGVLKANVNATEDEPVYTIEATLVEEAQTAFDK